MTMETILIIDDSPDIRLLLKSILQKRGYTMLVPCSCRHCPRAEI